MTRVFIRSPTQDTTSIFTRSFARVSLSGFRPSSCRSFISHPTAVRKFHRQRISPRPGLPLKKEEARRRIKKLTNEGGNKREYGIPSRRLLKCDKYGSGTNFSRESTSRDAQCPPPLCPFYQPRENKNSFGILRICFSKPSICYTERLLCSPRFHLAGIHLASAVKLKP